MLVITLLMTFFLKSYGGYVDYFYNKFTIPNATSLIIEDSRALQGIQPEIIINCFFYRNFNLPMFNFSFTKDGLNINKFGGVLFRKTIFESII